MKNWLLLFLLFTWLMPAQTIPVRRAREWNATAKDGYCNFRVQVEDEADFLLSGERLEVRPTKGAAKDVLTECTGPLPVRDESIRLGRVIRGRGDVRLHVSPSAGNNWSALIRVLDPAAGTDELEFRLDWGKGEVVDTEKKPSAAPDTRTSGEYDDRDLTKWKTRELRQEINHIYEQVSKRTPSPDDVDDYIDRVRKDGITLKDIRRELEGGKKK